MSKDNFLPEGYSIPVSSNYMKFGEGLNRFRILDKPIMGMEYWITNPEDAKKRMPMRQRMGEKIIINNLEINPISGKLDMPQHFWAMPVYNYQDKKIQILEVKQTGILKALKSYIENPKWGSPVQYDIVVTKEGQGLKTEYSIDHDPKEPMEQNVLDEYQTMYLNLEALFDGKDPFKDDSAETVAEAAADILGAK